MASRDFGSVSSASEADNQVRARNVSSSPRSSVSSLTSESASGEAKEKPPQEKICVVCGDVATGTHFAAMTCEGCKGFFRRSMKKQVEFTCAFDKQCAINKSNRKHCQACRLQKCIDMGMNASLIMSDESVEKKRALIKRNRERKAELKLKKQQEEQELKKEQKQDTPSGEVITLSDDDRALIKMMLASHEQSYDFSYTEFFEFRGTDQVAPPDPKELAQPKSTLAWYAAEREKAQAAPTKGRKAKKESTDSSDTAVTSSSGDQAASKDPSPIQGFNIPDLYSGNLGDVGDMFSSLHGTQKPGFLDNILQHAVASSMPRINSDGGSASSSSSSPYMTPAQNMDGFQSMFPTMSPLHDTNGNVMPGCQELPENGMYNLDLLESIQNFQGFFNRSPNQEHRQHSLFQHFCDIMTWGIKKVIEFCKCIPEFKELETVDQINLLRGGCLEMLVLRSYFAFASEGDKYKSDKFEYSPENFKEAGASNEFIEQYMKVHLRMRKMNLKVEEICLLLGLVLFSTDRPGIQDCAKVESMQKRIAQALRAYEYTNHPPDKACQIYSELLLLLPVLRTINVLFSNTIFTLKNQNEMDPLILEVNN